MNSEPNSEAGPRPGAGRGKSEEEWGRELAARDARLSELIDLAAHVRHEINNPLTGLIGQAQLLLRDEALSASARRRVETIEQLAKRIRDTVAELRVVQHGAPMRADQADPDADRADDPPRH
jgi:signal transduction histidine kinase